jgi:hypothetical protein
VIRIPTARRVADVFWPDFEERDGAVLLAGTRVTSPPESFESLAAFERFFGHTHLFEYDDPIVHFHQVRPGEQPWLSDAAADPGGRPRRTGGVRDRACSRRACELTYR